MIEIKEKKGHTAYNPDDYFCQICVYKSCLRQNKGREIIRNRMKQIEKKKTGSDL
ncbi:MULTISPECIES: hypothetical protein [Persephonella]|uniref:Uncharacterized protein n=1 Tax=Persephonella marina (strain DSM 14350 / EX-H1) TaxID=123214 RepID=C0QUH6_PERMH|nr:MULTISPECIES: hypothetical protein [Persephonella]ACO03099.1 hypothetical protein PERMA_0552 [Persephonella marina EX-H1]